MMKNLSEDDLRYLAGFFDGEGSVGLYHDRKENRWRASAEITQNYSRWVERLFNAWAAGFGGRVYLTKRGTIVVIFRGRGLKEFVGAVQKFTKLKTRQLMVLEQYLETKEFPFRAAQLLKTLKRST